MKNFLSSLIAVAALSWSGLLFAEIAVIVHPSSEVSSMTKDDVSRLFLGKTKSLPNGDLVIPLNQDEGQSARDVFNQKVCSKNANQYRAYWSKLIFTGKGTPPKDSGDSEAVKALVAANPKMIGYIDGSLVDGSVKVVFRLPN